MHHFKTFTMSQIQMTAPATILARKVSNPGYNIPTTGRPAISANTRLTPILILTRDAAGALI
jgi:hypothetical protein